MAADVFNEQLLHSFFFSWRQSQQQAKPPSDHTATILYLSVAPSLLSVALFANICYIIQTSLLFCRSVSGEGVSSFLDVEGQWARGQWYWGVAGRVTFQKTSWLSGIFLKDLENTGVFCRFVSRVVNQINTAFLSCNKKECKRKTSLTYDIKKSRQTCWNRAKYSSITIKVIF